LSANFRDRTLVADAICFGLETELPLRGAIAVGEALLDSTSGMFLGEPLVEVARTEREQQWIGVSFGPSFSKPGFSEGFHLNTVLPYKSHYKEREGEYAMGRPWTGQGDGVRAGNQILAPP
jgi:hypothetical protein